MRRQQMWSALLVPGFLIGWVGVVAAAPPSEFTSKVTVAPDAIKHNGPAEFSVSLLPRAALANGVVDLEIYNAKNVRIAQHAWQGQTLAKGRATKFHWTWKPAQPGTYTVKIGVFGTNWKPLHFWNDRALTLKVG